MDTVIIVAALDRDLNLRRLERYLALAWASGAEPVVLLNKADLCDDVVGRLGEVRAIAAGRAGAGGQRAPRGNGLDGARRYLGPGRTVVLLGSSGVGKSTITNALLGEQRQVVREVREDDSRGRHTTTARELFQLPGGALLIDTPGHALDRSVGRRRGPRAGVRRISRRSPRRCRFADCTHEVEPGCAVLAAIAAGELAPDRLRARRKLHRELGLVAAQTDARRVAPSRERWGKVTREAARHAEAKRRGWAH